MKPLGLSLNVVSSPFHCSEVNCEGQQPTGFSVTKKKYFIYSHLDKLSTER